MFVHDNFQAKTAKHNFTDKLDHQRWVFRWLRCTLLIDLKKEHLILFRLHETEVFTHKNGWTDFHGLGPEQTPLNPGFIFPIS